MKVTLSLILCQILICIGCVSLDSQAQQQEDKLKEKSSVVNSKKQNQQDKKEWQPATYKDLIMGTSTYEDMLRVFGSPLDIVPGENERDEEFQNSPVQEVWYYYNADGNIPGKLVVGVNNRTKRIIRIIIRAQDSYLSKEEVIKHYGNNYVITRYSFDNCLGDGDSAPLYESPDGSIKSLEYRERGISAILGYDDTIREIVYESKPLGSPESKCKDSVKNSQDKKEWQPATYKGLIMGTSTRDDMLRILGEPKDFSEYKELEKNSEPNAEIEYFYDNAGEFSGDLIIGVNNSSKKIMWIRLRPQKLSKEEAISHFGNDYIITRYDFDDCIDNMEGSPIFESPDGQVVLIEYRKRGIFFGLKLKNEDQVDEVSYISKPPGSPSSRCKTPLP